MGEQITNLPCLDEEKCTGCGLCVANCPGLAITILDKSYSQAEATIDFPFEYLPLPVEGDIVDAVSRGGETVCKGAHSARDQTACLCGHGGHPHGGAAGTHR